MTILIVATVVAYLPALRGGFVFDDELYVSNNPTLRSTDGLRAIWLHPAATTQYYPLVFTTYWIEYRRWGLNPLGYHATNIVLHAANTLLVRSVLCRLGVPGAVFAAGIFALHPVHVESVAWITERKDVLSGMFYLLAVMTWLRFFATRRWRSYVLSVALFLCALLSKSMTCTLPLTLLLVAWWTEGRQWRRKIAPVLPFLVISVGLGLVTMWRESLFHSPATATPPLALLQRGLVAARALWFYAGKLLWPVNLMALYPRWQVDVNAAWQYAFVVGAIAVPLILWLARSRFGKGPLVAVLFFAITLGPASGLLRFDFQRLSYVADRFQYLASLGPIALLTAVLATSRERWRTLRPWAAHVVTALVLCALALLTWEHARVYADEETLWRDTILKNPGAASGHYNLGLLLLDQGKLDEAIQQFAAAVAIDPQYSEAHLNWGVAADRRGDLDEAMAQYRAELEINPASAHARNNLATALFRLGQVDEALEQFAIAARADPSYAEAQNNWGLALALQGRTDEAVERYVAALRINPDLADAHKNLGVALVKKGALHEALGHLQKAVRLNPRDNDARAQLDAVMHLREGPVSGP